MMHFTVLASGSTGNSAFLQSGPFGLLLDFGLTPKTIALRLKKVAAAWDDVHAVLLSHVHGDHWNEFTLAELLKRRIPCYLHPKHAQSLERESAAYPELVQAGLVRYFSLDDSWNLTETLTVRAFPVSHDTGLTCGFRIEGPGDLLGRRPTLGWATDLGTWSDAIVDHLAGVDVLGLEFNHDVAMQVHSGRPRFLIERVLGDFGHLSNEQAADLLAAILERPESERLGHLLQVHLSQQCNRPDLAKQAVRKRLRDFGFAIHAASPTAVGPTLRVEIGGRAASRERRPVAVSDQPWLPGWEE